MRLHLRLFACCIAIGLLTACQANVPPPVTAATAPTQEQREMATLSFLAYLGDALTGSDEKVETELDDCMVAALGRQEGVRRWELAWGPAVYHFSVTKLDDNMMYAVRDTENPANLAVVVRGTNPRAFLDWLVEDFDVVDQVSWPSGNPPGQAKTSKGTSEGLQILKTMTPEGGPVPNQTLLQFLQSQASPSGLPLQVTVTGHSLGGALTPALALWLTETLGGKARISVYTLAGPTSGNAEFAAYYDSVLGSVTQRLWNPFDAVPLAWNYESMGKMEDLYEPLTRANPAERGLIDGLRSLVKDKGYTQIDINQASLSGAVNPEPEPGKRTDWVTEAGWQHHCGYQCALGISVRTSVPGCPSKGVEFPCPAHQCPSGSGN